MSSNIYTLKIAIDDSKIREIEKRLMNIVGGGTTGGLGSKVTDTAKGGSISKNIAKLGAIAIGVASLVALVSKIQSMLITSSPMLQQMLRLLNFGIMLILRPIGDFIGFFLRPLIIYFMRSIALPWYRMSRPIMQKLGALLGSSFVRNLTETDKSKGIPVWEEGFNHEEGMKNLESAMLGWASLFDLISPGQFETTKTAIADIKSFAQNVSDWITGFEMPTLGNIAMGFKKWVLEQTSQLPDFFVYVEAGIKRWIGDLNLPTWGDLTALLDKITLTITTIVTAFSNFFIAIAKLLGIEIGGNTDTSTPPPVSTPAPTYTDETGSQQPTDAHPWMTETPETKSSDWNKSRH